MKKHCPILLSSLIWSAPYNQNALANLADQCLLGVPDYNKPLVRSDTNHPVHIQANKAEINYPETAQFSGNVNIEQGNSTLSADRVHLHQQNHYKKEPIRTITASGNVNYFSNEIKLNGPKAWVNFNTKDIEVYQGNYQLVGRQGRGAANIMKQRGDNRYTVLENGSFTSCLPGDDSWSVVGSKIILNRQKQVAEIWNASFKIGKVPIFYSPYLQLAVGNQRRSGFLIPNAKYSNSNGFEFSIPSYFNLAPNYDATLTPNYISNHGIQILTEFRYLSIPGKGVIEFDWLPNDRLYSAKHPDKNGNDRWLLYWQYNSVINKVWRINIDYIKVSDSDYFYDLNSKYGDTTDGYTTQKCSFGYTDQSWNISLSYKQFQIFDTNMNHAYRATPELEISYYKNDFRPFNIEIFSQVAKFTNMNHAYPEATRMHIEPILNLLLTNRWGSLNTKTKLMATHYQQKNIDNYNATTNTQRYLEHSINRVMPQFKTEGKMVFERDMRHFSKSYTQTLEPQLQYMYVPYRNQNNINIYDSTILQNDYSGLFRDHSYSGLDRISSANQLASGATTRVYDHQRIERFNASVGQLFYFSRPRTGDITGTWDNYNKTGSMLWTGNSHWRISNHWGFRGGIQYDTYLNNLMLSDVVLEYRRNENCILQLNYHYASPQYIKKMIPEVTHLNYQQGISQVGLIGSWPLLERWALIGTYYYDTKANQLTNQLLGLQYNTCCWAVNVGYERKVTGWNNFINLSKYDNRVSFNIELRGLSNNYHLGMDNMLNSSIFPYQQIL